jgi:hypothetical protein
MGAMLGLSMRLRFLGAAGFLNGLAPEAFAHL